MNQIPEVAAALVCQSLITDSLTQMRTLTNIFWNLQISIPGSAGFGLYIKMIDGEGHYSARIRLVRLRDEQVILSIPAIQFDWVTPFQPVELGINFPQVSIEEEGLHEFQIFMNDAYVGRTAFNVKKITPPVGTGGAV